jgi:hypothetical protein
VQGSALWAKLLNRTLTKLGYTCNRADASVFTRVNKYGTVHLGAVVDDFAIVGSTNAAIAQAKTEIACVWDCTDFGSLSWYIQMSVTRNRNTGQMSLSQQTYIEKLMHRYMTLDPKLVYRPYDTPMDNTKQGRLSLLMSPATEQEREFMRTREYRGLLGSLKYARHTRPDILQAVNECAKYQTNQDRNTTQPQYESCFTSTTRNNTESCGHPQTRNRPSPGQLPHMLMRTGPTIPTHGDLAVAMSYEQTETS